MYILYIVDSNSFPQDSLSNALQKLATISYELIFTCYLILANYLIYKAADGHMPRHN